jgi:mycothiol synthase
MAGGDGGGPARLEVAHRIDEGGRVAIDDLLDRARVADGHEPVADQARLALAGGGGELTAIVARATDGGRSADTTAGRLVGLAALEHLHHGWSVELVIDPVRRHDSALSAALLEAAAAEVAAAGGGRLQYWAPKPTGATDALAGAHGLTVGRDLFQMRRPLPLSGDHPSLPTRAFRPGVDEDAWLAVNNRAFADHHEQGGWTRATLEQREHEPWFDPAGFLLHERDGRLAAFCWTKVHSDTTPVLGEIYVIAVDPDFQGLGLGRSMTVTGLDHLATTGIDTGMLYVDAANHAAVGLYRALGFTVDHIDRAYVGTVPPRS